MHESTHRSYQNSLFKARDVKLTLAAVEWMNGWIDKLKELPPLREIQK